MFSTCICQIKINLPTNIKGKFIHFNFIIFEKFNQFLIKKCSVWCLIPAIKFVDKFWIYCNKNDGDKFLTILKFFCITFIWDSSIVDTSPKSPMQSPSALLDYFGPWMFIPENEIAGNKFKRFFFQIFLWILFFFFFWKKLQLKKNQSLSFNLKTLKNWSNIIKDDKVLIYKFKIFDLHDTVELSRFGDFPNTIFLFPLKEKKQGRMFQGKELNQKFLFFQK